MKKKPVHSKDRFAEVTQGFRQLTAERLESVLAKRQKIQIRVSESDKAEIAATAGWLELTATEYLLRLHYLAVKLLKGRIEKSKTKP